MSTICAVIELHISVIFTWVWKKLSSFHVHTVYYYGVATGQNVQGEKKSIYIRKKSVKKTGEVTAVIS